MPRRPFHIAHPLADGNPLWLQVTLGASSLMGLLSISLTVRGLGEATYGYFVLLMDAFAYLGVVVAGMNPLAMRALAGSGAGRFSRVFSEFLGAYGLVLVVVLALGLTSGFLWWAVADPYVRIMALLSAVVILAGRYFNLSFYARQRFRTYSLVDLLPSLFNLVVLIGLVLTGRLTLEALITVQLVSGLLRMAWLVARLREHVDPSRFGRGVRRLCRERKSIGSFLTISVGAQMIFYTDTIVAGYTMGAAAAGILALHLKLPRLVERMLWQYADAQYPALSLEVAEGRGADLRRRVVRTLRRLLGGGVVMLVSVGLGGELFYRLWLGTSLVFDQLLNWTILIVGFVYTISHFLGVVINSLGLESRVAPFVLVEGFVNLGLSLLLADLLGLRGIVLATLLAHLMVMVPVLVVQLSGYLRRGGATGIPRGTPAVETIAGPRDDA